MGIMRILHCTNCANDGLLSYALLGVVLMVSGEWVESGRRVGGV